MMVSVHRCYLKNFGQRAGAEGLVFLLVSVLASRGVGAERTGYCRLGCLADFFPHPILTDLIAVSVQDSRGGSCYSYFSCAFQK